MEVGAGQRCHAGAVSNCRFERVERRDQTLWILPWDDGHGSRHQEIGQQTMRGLIFRLNYTTGLSNYRQTCAAGSFVKYQDTPAQSSGIKCRRRCCHRNRTSSPYDLGGKDARGRDRCALIICGGNIKDLAENYVSSSPIEWALCVMISSCILKASSHGIFRVLLVCTPYELRSSTPFCQMPPKFWRTEIAATATPSTIIATLLW